MSARPRRAPQNTVGLLLLAVAACAGPGPDDSGPPVAQALVDLNALALDDTGGPFAPLAVRQPCVAAGWAVEGDSFEVSTDACAPGAFQAPALLALRLGDRVQLTRWHLALDAPQPATGRRALALEDEVVWSEALTIPADESVATVDVEVAAPHAVGAPVTLLVENHGANAYRFTALRALPVGN